MNRAGGPGARLSPEMFERILAVTRHLAAPFDLATMLTEVIDAGREILEAERGSVFLYDRDTDELVSVAATALEQTRFPANRGISGECAQSRRIINVQDAYADSRFNPEIDRQTGFRTRSLLTIPLVGHDESLVGVLQLLNKRDGSFDAEDEAVAAALGAQCAVALQRVQMTEQLMLKEKMDRELALARDIQTGFQPQKMPEVPGYDVFGMSRPADETGGDTFDLIPLDERDLVLLLGDATGHGIGPALSVTQVRSMLRIAMRLEAPLDATLRQINNQLADDLPGNRFVTAFLGLLDVDRHAVRYHSAGQGPLMHFHAARGECEWLAATTIPMGMLKHSSPPAAEQIDLAPGDVLGLITDGVFEYDNASQEEFGESRVAEIVREHHDKPMAELSARLLRAVHAFAGAVRQKDDITMVLVKRLAD